MKTFLSLLLVLSQLSRSTRAVIDDAASGSEGPCRARAWVRAPDLEPGEVIQGQVKVKLDGACEDVSSYTLRLRFAERAWVKTRRTGIKLPERPAANSSITTSSRESIFDISDPFWMFQFGQGVDAMALEKYESDMKDPSLWLVREKETVGFEAKYNLDNVGRDLMKSFAILVPITNYPPAFDGLAEVHSRYDTHDAGSEHIYAYFVDVAFANGTYCEIPAGITSFSPRTAMAPPRPETVNVSAVPNPLNHRRSGRIEVQPRDQFTLEVTFPHGRHIEQGTERSKVNVSVTSHQLGPGLQRPKRIHHLDVRVNQKRHWAAHLAADNETAEELLNYGRISISQLIPTDPRVKDSRRWGDICNDKSELTRPTFSQEGLIENGTVFTTKAVTAQFEVPHNCYPPFEMHYQTSEVQLQLVLAVQTVSPMDMKGPAAHDDEEYEWTPTITQKETTWFPADLHYANIPLFVHPKQDDRSQLVASRTTHYTSPEARVPIFVDPSTIKDLLQKTIDERDALAPKAQANTTTYSDGEIIVRSRYYGTGWWPGQPGRYYVGDTWLRKVILPNKDKENAAYEGGPKFVVQS